MYLWLPILAFVVIGLIERIWPRSAPPGNVFLRWRAHAALFLCNKLTSWLIAFVVTLPAVAIWTDGHGYGLLRFIPLSGWAKWIVIFVALDLAIWWQHRMMHKIPFLWRWHSVHHGDNALDVTTALRFHPGELVISTLYKCLLILLLGVPAIVAIGFEVWLNINAMFNHSNIRLSRRVDRLISYLWVTPDMHLVHHSILPGEQHMNFGFSLSVWDRIFGSYQCESVTGQSHQITGLEGISPEAAANPVTMLKMPFS
jgi:sterol desaturase/sphingolipid hydroxylase (fatty acid hydroxylase superfamily)